MNEFNVGGRVQIIRQDIFDLKHRLAKGPVYGRITDIDGDYILVQPTWCKWEIELYPCEIRKLEEK